MTNQEIAILAASIVAANSPGSGGSTPDNIFRLAAAYREIYATIKDVDQCEQSKGPPRGYKDQKTIERQLGLLVQVNDLIFLEIANNSLNSPLNSVLLDALNKNVTAILNIVTTLSTF